PEQVQSMEIGYKSLINNNLMIDFSYYFNIYHDFISQVRIRKASEFTTDQALYDANKIDYSYNPLATDGDINYGSLLNGTADNTFQIYTNINDIVTSQGLALGLDYSLLKGYSLTGNYSWNVINNVPEGFLSEFNTPEHKFNVGFGNRKLTDNLGFNVTYRWQSEFWWESSFTISRNGMVPQYGTMDAQITYKLEDLKSKLKIGGSNILNKQYIQSLGGPNIGALFYVSLTFDELMN
ncbi:MAG: TonB-dependent receptor, partial [Cyclobacteriaceae bacterium]|nr:TonB-dependent receptor [Cyclobacteriaceae bacterium]